MQAILRSTRPWLEMANFFAESVDVLPPVKRIFANLLSFKLQITVLFLSELPATKIGDRLWFDK